MDEPTENWLAKSIERAGRTLDIYDRVHIELDGGKEFADIDNGMRDDKRGISYDKWFEYMQFRLVRHAKDIVLTYRHYDMPLPKRPRTETALEQPNAYGPHSIKRGT